MRDGILLYVEAQHDVDKYHRYLLKHKADIHDSAGVLPSFIHAMQCRASAVPHENEVKYIII